MASGRSRCPLAPQEIAQSLVTDPVIDFSRPPVPSQSVEGLEGGKNPLGNAVAELWGLTADRAGRVRPDLFFASTPILHYSSLPASRRRNPACAM